MRGQDKWSLTIIFILCSYSTTLLAIPIDNGVIGEPNIVCGADSITIDVVTRNPFKGNIFSKGHYDQPECRSLGDSMTNTLSFTIFLSQTSCGVRRTREVSSYLQAGPRGMAIEATIVISFHPLFITKVDRAYRLACFYMESKKVVTSSFDVSMLTTQSLSGEAEMPVCTYEILRGGITGARLRYAKIGDAVYHKWTCVTEEPDMFCMKVHSCTVNNGNGDSAVPVLDEDGCATDRFILPNLEYMSDLTAGQEAHVFKFADHPMLFFDCKIEVKIKNTPTSCKELKPICSDASRKRRANPDSFLPRGTSDVARSKNGDAAVSSYDLESQQLIVFDIDADEKITDGELLELDQVSGSGRPLRSSAVAGSICLAPVAFALYLCGLAVIGALIICMIVALLSKLKHRRLKDVAPDYRSTRSSKAYMSTDRRCRDNKSIKRMEAETPAYVNGSYGSSG